jgi:hypothetical protein
MAKLEGAERQRMLDAFAQSDAIHRLEGFEPTELRKQLDQAVLDGLATNRKRPVLAAWAAGSAASMMPTRAHLSVHVGRKWTLPQTRPSRPIRWAAVAVLAASIPSRIGEKAEKGGIVQYMGHCEGLLAW